MLAVLAVALSPYLLVAAAVGVLLSGAQVLPGTLKFLVPSPVRDAASQVEQLQRAPQVKQVRAMAAEALRREQRLQHAAEVQAGRLGLRDWGSGVRGQEPGARELRVCV